MFDYKRSNSLWWRTGLSWRSLSARSEHVWTRERERDRGGAECRCRSLSSSGLSRSELWPRQAIAPDAVQYAKMATVRWQECEVCRRTLPKREKMMHQNCGIFRSSSSSFSSLVDGSKRIVPILQYLHHSNIRIQVWLASSPILDVPCPAVISVTKRLPFPPSLSLSLPYSFPRSLFALSPISQPQ